ncbi:MAG TPA: adenylate kinase family protein [Methanothermobacter sp.]|nr:putative adenylate kinase [Methanothermobacter sp. MT-2]HHW05734.1 AAA family ATPase [Methanothermobacter sp.]HOK72951.1 adenylate kinase family protein [Methanothermobacter sp.]HOL69257.1 adenylate kinase family protein [Methanothermobacter sp.]HPQ04475.1 adenylate kinase family protein [Methanothermobacter sp.]
MRKASVVCITGTPGVGKTTVSKKLKGRLDANLIEVNRLAEEKGLLIGEDPLRGYRIVDIPSLCREIEKVISQDSFNIVEGHLSHYCRICDLVIVLRLDPGILWERLEGRGYDHSKVNENVEAEALGVCAYEAYQLHKGRVHEIDVTSLSLDEVLDEIIGVLEGEKPCTFGGVDFMEWFLDGNFLND